MFVRDKEFEIFIKEEDILQRVKILAKEIEDDYKDLNPLVISVLNGSFMFASDLIKEINIPLEVSFIRLASYENIKSTGTVTELLGIKENISGRHILIIEDIVETGRTLVYLKEKLSTQPASVEIASLLVKPSCCTHNLKVKYEGFEIPDKFVIGYGLDYNGHGRNLKNIYKVKF